MAKKKIVYPDTTLQHVLRVKGYPAQCLWEMPGPKNTTIAWITAYAVGGIVIIVQTYSEGGWEAYLPCESIDVTNTIDAVVRRIAK